MKIPHNFDPTRPKSAIRLLRSQEGDAFLQALAWLCAIRPELEPAAALTCLTHALNHIAGEMPPLDGLAGEMQSTAPSLPATAAPATPSGRPARTFADRPLSVQRKQARPIAKRIIGEYGIDPKRWEDSPFHPLTPEPHVDRRGVTSCRDADAAFEEVMDYAETAYIVGMEVGRLIAG